jgi:glycosyltransferase involved in cell wall biosynthesis
MRILLVSHKFPPHSLGGVEIYTHNLAESLRARHQVAVFYRHDDGDGSPFAEHDEDLDGILTRRVSCNPGGLAASAVGEFLETFLSRQIEDSFARFVAQLQPDLIHIQHVMALSARLLHLARESGAPVILTLHDYWFICGNSQLIWPDAQTCLGKALGMNCVRCAAAARFPSPLVRWLRLPIAPVFVYRDRLVGHAARQAHQFLSPSQFLIDQYVAAGFPAQRFLYLENGIPVDAIRRHPWQPSDGPLRVTFLGSLAWQKGVHVLVEAFNGLANGVARLRIWGDLTVFPDYVDNLRQISTLPDTQFMGRIANDRVGEVMADSDVVVVPSLWFENSPVVIQEARAAGVPVVASGHGALAEKVRHGVDGLHFPPGDAIALRNVLQRLVDERDLLARLGEKVPAPMDMSDHVQQLETIYQQAMERTGHMP